MYSMVCTVQAVDKAIPAVSQCAELGICIAWFIQYRL